MYIEHIYVHMYVYVYIHVYVHIRGLYTFIAIYMNGKANTQDICMYRHIHIHTYVYVNKNKNK